MDTGSSSLVKAEADNAALEGGGASVESLTVQEWESSEDAEPIDPYRVLGCGQSEDSTALEARYRRKVGMCDNAADGASPGATYFLKRRIERAYALLSNVHKRAQYDGHKKKHIKANSWAVLRYANGLYEGGVEPDSMVSGSEPVRSGKGVMVLAAGEKYEGRYADNMKAGTGTCFWQTGDLYVGQWQEDKMSGHGCYYYSKGQQYFGEFLHNRRHGVGRQTWPDGSVYYGEFQEGLRTGEGVLELPKDYAKSKSSRYVGQWLAGSLHGHGCFEDDDGNVYKGDFEANHFHGEGRLEMAGGDIYTGYFFRGKRDGKGSYDWINGDNYSGLFRENRRDAAGTFTSPMKCFEFKGEWQEDRPHGEGEFCLTRKIENTKSVMTSTGQWHNGSRQGQGKVIWPSGARFIGAFESDKQQGPGLFMWPDGSSWEGAFNRGAQDGAGILRGPPQPGSSQPAFEQVEIYSQGELVVSDAAKQS